MKKVMLCLTMLIVCSTMQSQTDFAVISPSDKVNNSPWYGLGRSSIILPNSYNQAIQLAGYYGLLFKTANGLLSMNHSGNVGIGTTDPNSKLHVVGSILSEVAGSQSIIATIEGSTVLNYSKFQILNKRNSNGSSWSNTSMRLQRVVDNTPQAFIDFGIENKNSNYGLAFGTRNGYNGTQQVRMVIEENGDIGIGTTTPMAKLDVNGAGMFRTPAGGGIALNITLADNTNSMTLRAYDDRGEIHLQNNRSFGIKDTQGNLLIYGKHGGNVGIGTTTPDAKLAVNGKIHTKEVKVDLLGWSDFVFKKAYQLPTLEEVEKHIKENGHLKDIPSEKEVLKNGIHLGEMNAKLLQKIEELTLYAIAQEKKIIKQQEKTEIQNAKIEQQAKELKSLKGLSVRLAVIEKLLQKK